MLDPCSRAGHQPIAEATPLLRWVVLLVKGQRSSIRYDEPSPVGIYIPSKQCKSIPLTAVSYVWAAFWEASYHAMQWHLPWGDVNPWSCWRRSSACCTILGPSPILTLRRREGAELRVYLYHERNIFSGFQGQVLPWG